MSRDFDRFVGFDFAGRTDKADIAATLRQAGALGIGNGAGTFGSASSYVNASALSDPMDMGRVHAIAKSFVSSRIASLREEEVSLDKQAADLRNKAAVLGEAGKCVAPWHLSAPDGSSFHSALEAIHAGRAYRFDNSWREIGKVTGDWNEYVTKGAHVFLVEHDWARAFEKSDMDGGEVRLPHDQCVFEFVLNGVRVCVWCEEESKPIIFVKAGKVWGIIAEDGNWPFLTKQIRCICIALDAAVVKSEVVRAPHKLNHARERQGKLPIFDHHVVSLMRRDRPERLAAGEPGTRKRLHWRRGHWRHYSDHKTWLNWMLVGDPDLGFVDKHYRL